MHKSGGCVWQVDSKKELEKLLKVTCEAFIMSVTKASVEPLLSFITKVTAVRARSKHVTQNRVAGPQPPKAVPLREQVYPPCLACVTLLSSA